MISAMQMKQSKQIQRYNVPGGVKILRSFLIIYPGLIHEANAFT